MANGGRGGWRLDGLGHAPGRVAGDRAAAHRAYRDHPDLSHAQRGRGTHKGRSAGRDAGRGRARARTAAVQHRRLAGAGWPWSGPARGARELFRDLPPGAGRAERGDLCRVDPFRRDPRLRVRRRGVRRLGIGVVPELYREPRRFPDAAVHAGPFRNADHRRPPPRDRPRQRHGPGVRGAGAARCRRSPPKAAAMAGLPPSTSSPSHPTARS